MEIKAIETVYKGYRFRSRLEARWAVFFDALGIEWVYEPEGFELPNGSRYLPDFFLPNLHEGKGTFVEVKARFLNEEERKKANLLCLGTGCCVLLAVGVPTSRIYTLLYINEENQSLMDCDICFVSKYLPIGKSGNSHEYRFFVFPGYENKDGTINDEDMDDNILHAIHCARQARFEHGERGSYGRHN